MPQGRAAQLNNVLLRLGLVSVRSRTYRFLFYLSLFAALRRRVFGREEVLVAREILAPGQFVRITALGPPPSRRQIRGARRAAKGVGGGAVQR